MINKELFEGPVGDYCIARNTIKCLFRLFCTLQFHSIFLCPNCALVALKLCSFNFKKQEGQRALVRSPEEKVKGHSGAIYGGPLMLYTKYQGSSRFFQEEFQDFPILLYINHICPPFPPVRAPFYTRGIIWIFFLATNQNHLNNFDRGPGFGQISISGSREEIVWSFPYIIQCKIVTPGAYFEQHW